MLMPIYRRFWSLPLLASCAAAASPASAPVILSPAAPSVAELVQARQAGMHMAATLLYTGIKNGVKSGADVKNLLHEPDGLAMWAAAIPGLFPDGSSHPQSRAKVEIWSNQADFRRKAATLGAAADRLADLGRAGDAAGYVAQVPAVEAACTGCHSAYRSD
jgi:cytochrome c556